MDVWRLLRSGMVLPHDDAPGLLTLSISCGAKHRQLHARYQPRPTEISAFLSFPLITPSARGP
jgi:hypothetical protein